MNYENLKFVPKWALEDVNHDLVLSNDIDSLASCAVLKKVKGWNIKYFYDFNNVYKVKDHVGENEKCWVDVAVKEGHAYDNHVSKISLMDDWNDEMVNLNQMFWISHENYGDKYAGSTLLEIWSLYNLPLPKKEEGLMILLAIDVAFKGFYNDNFHNTQKYYLVDILGFQELYDVIRRHSKDEFYGIITKFGLNADIVCKDGKLNSKLRLDRIGQLLELDLHIPEETFEVEEKFDVINEEIQTYHNCLDDVCTTIKTLAFTYKNKMTYSKVHREPRQSSYDLFLSMIGRTRECTYVEE